MPEFVVGVTNIFCGSRAATEEGTMTTIEAVEETMRYMLLICAGDDVELSPEESAQMGPATDAWVKEMDGRGIRLEGHELRPASDATTVQLRGGELLISDGPFAETKEQIAGFDIIECRDLDEALEVAAKHPVARFGTIEVRPFWME